MTPTGPDTRALAEAAAAGELSILQASQLLEVPAPTIRSWERRYGIPRANRSSGGHRRYTPEQVETLRRLRDAIAHGQTAAAAAASVNRSSPTSSGPLVERFLLAAQRLDPRGVTQALDASCATRGLDGTLDDVLFPALQQIGRNWEIGRCDVAHEHLATESTRQWLSAIERDGTRRRQPRGTVLLACGPRDVHSLGLEAIAALLRRRGWDCRHLGASTPAESLAIAVEHLRPSAVVVVSHLSVARRSAVEALRAVRRSDTQLFYAGNAFLTRQARHGVPGTYLGENLSRAADLVTRVAAA